MKKEFVEVRGKDTQTCKNCGHNIDIKMRMHMHSGFTTYLTTRKCMMMDCACSSPEPQTVVNQQSEIQSVIK